jgi:hypothetical protein
MRSLIAPPYRYGAPRCERTLGGELAIGPELPVEPERDYRRLYEDHVPLANEGCDLDFLRGRSPVVADALTYP